MNEDFPPCAGCRPTSSPGIEDLPPQWSIAKLRQLLRPVVERYQADLPLLSVVREQGVILRDMTASSENHNSIPVDLSNYKIVRVGHFVINKMKAWQGSFGVSAVEGVVSPAYFVFAVSGVDPQFFGAAIRSAAYTPSFARASDGVRVGQWDLVESRMRDISFVVPPPSDQVAIVRFLAHVDHRINRRIRLKRRLAGLLEEQKQAVIHRAVTRGLDPTVRLASSGVEWLGQVPASWKRVRLKDVSIVQTGLTLGKNYGDARLVERPYLRVANVQAGLLDLGKVTTIRVPTSEADGSTLRRGDVLMTEGGDIDKLGRGCVWDGEIPGCLHQNHVFAVRPERGVLLPEFLVAVMASRHGRTYFQITAKQTTNLAATNSTTLRCFPLFLPEIEVQARILEWIDAESRPLDSTIARARREVSLLREYRTRLIADVVTGKLDVRDVAAGLSDETDDGGNDHADASDTEDASPEDETDVAPEEAEA